jgi:hypothetical protein
MPPPLATHEHMLRRYQEGRLTAQGLILAVLSLTSKSQLAEVLPALPPQLLEQLKDFADHYQAGMKVFNGPRPKMAAMRFVKEWFQGGRELR